MASRKSTAEPAPPRKLVRRRHAPKYLQVARTLSARIADGSYPVGSMLPTETELLKEFGVGRQTVRQAVALLNEWSLVFTRHGSGSAVRASGCEAGYVQRFGSLAELVQHDTRTHIQYEDSDRIVVDQERSRLIGCAPGQDFWRLTILRRTAGAEPPSAWIDLYIRDSHRQIIELIGDSPNKMIHRLLEEGYGERVVQIHQEISARKLPPDAAAALGVASGETGLRAIRRYYGSHHRLIWTGVNYHAAGHFGYTTTMYRETD